MNTNGMVAGAAIKRRRENLDLSQVKLASLASCSLQTITNFERGALPTKRKSEPLLRVLTTLDELESRPDIAAAVAAR